MYENIGPGDVLGLGNVCDFGTFHSWSSTENDNDNTWGHVFDDGSQYYSIVVRAVRAF